MKTNLIYTITIVFLLLLTSPVTAQRGIDPGPDPDETPIDGGISLLIAGGTALGIYALKKKNKL